MIKLPSSFQWPFFAAVFLLFACVNQSSETNKYGLDVVADMQRYQKLVEKNPDKRFVDLEEEAQGIVFDIRYATANNFTGQIIYDTPRAFVRKPVAEALKEIQKELKEKGLGLKVFDAYRPYAATVKFYEVYPDTNFVAAPWHGSRHNRGCAVDVTLVDLHTGKQLPMPTPFDDFSEKAAPAYMQLPDTVIKNRQLLIDVMTRHGFSTYPYEWWHFDFKGWENYELTDLPFEALDRISL